MQDNLNFKMEKTKSLNDAFRLNRSEVIGIIIGISIIAVSGILLLAKVSFFDVKIFYFVAGISVGIMGLPFFLNLISEGKRDKNIEQMFLEFSRDLVEGVRSGTPINKTIINLKRKDYGSLNPHIAKLANQIELGIPVQNAFQTFSKDINNTIIKRSVNLIREAERSGGKIESILESVTFSVGQISKLKKEREASVYSLTIQGYIIFLIFIIIMLVLEFKVFPIVATLNQGLSTTDSSDISGIISSCKQNFDINEFSESFMFLLIAQGFFAGLIIGKISDGNLKAGLKHSFVLVILSWIISTAAQTFLG